jgi:hypothetical protein
MGVVGHLLRGLGHAIGRVILWFLIFGLIGAALVEVVAYVESTPHQAFGLLTNIAAAAVGIILGYAAGLTVVVAEVVRLLTEAIREAQKGVEGDLGNLGNIAGGVVKEIEKRI